MRWVVLLIVAGLASSVQCSLLARIGWAPDLPVALCAWLIVQGGLEFALPRMWLVLLIADAVDPGARYFHSLTGLGLILPTLLVQDRLQGIGSLACFVWGCSWSVCFDCVDAWMAGWWFPGFWPLVIGALQTGIVALLFGGLLGALPRGLRPVPPPKDPAWATLAAR